MSEENKNNSTEETAEDSSSSETTKSPEVLALEGELQKAKNDYLYLRADFDNYKKSVIRERADLMKYGGERVFVELLDIVDNFERALATELNTTNIEAYRSGVKLIFNNLKNLLSRFGVNELPSEGAAFDPNVHEALGAEPTEETQPGHITRVLRKPYKLHDRVIRPGQVIVASEKPKS